MAVVRCLAVMAGGRRLASTAPLGVVTALVVGILIAIIVFFIAFFFVVITLVVVWKVVSLAAAVRRSALRPGVVAAPVRRSALGILRVLFSVIIVATTTSVGVDMTPVV